MTTTIFSVPGMHCASCPKLIAMTLEDTAGVSSVDAQLEGKTVAVNYDETAVDEAALCAAIKEAGYEASSMPAETGPLPA